jgi:hypothetical protein
MTSVTDAGGPDSRRLGLALAAVLFAMLLVPNLAVAQAHCEATVDTSDAALAARYASVLRFAPNEPYFPTIPFFSAFDRAIPYTPRGMYSTRGTPRVSHV